MNPRSVAWLLLAVASILPRSPVHAAPVLCPFRRLTGRPCPACGLTRSWQATTHWRLREGVAMHPLGPLTVLAAGWFVVDPDAPRRVARTGPHVRVALGAGWLLVWAARLRVASSGARAPR